MINITLKRSEKRAIRLGMMVLGLVVILNLVVFPFYDHMKELSQRKQTLIRDLKTMVDKLAEADDLDRQIERFKRQIDANANEAIKGDSEELAQVALEELITNLAKEQDLQVTNSYKEKTKTDRFGYRRVAARVTVQGEYAAIIHFLEAIQNRPELIAATDLSLKHYRGYSATVTVMGLAK